MFTNDNVEKLPANAWHWDTAPLQSSRGEVQFNYVKYKLIRYCEIIMKEKSVLVVVVVVAVVVSAFVKNWFQIVFG